MTKTDNKFTSIFNKASSNRKLYVFLFCLVLAIFFWLLNALSKNFTNEIVFKVEYTNAPPNKIVVNELPQQIKIKIKGLGFDLLAYKLRLKESILNINLSQIEGAKKQVDKLERIQLPTTFFSSSIGNQLGEDIEIKEIYPESLVFILDDEKEKVLKIVPVTKIEYEKQFQLFGKIIVKPAVVKVVGPASILDTLTQIYTQNKVYNNLSETVSESVGFKTAYALQKIKFSEEKVLLYIPVEKYTETAIAIKIETINTPDSLLIKAIPNEIELKFMLPLSKMANLASAKFKAVVDYHQINENMNHKLKVELIEYPEYIQSSKLTPNKVEYILKRK